MTNKTRHCDECDHFNTDALYDECPCDKEHRARFYKPRWPLDTDYGWKRKCTDFREKTPNDEVSSGVTNPDKSADVDPSAAPFC